MRPYLPMYQFDKDSGWCLNSDLYSCSPCWVSRKLLTCVWDGVLYAADTRTLCIVHLLLHAWFVMTPAPSITLCAIASYSLLHSDAQVTFLTDSTRWTGVEFLVWHIIKTLIMLAYSPLTPIIYSLTTKFEMLWYHVMIILMSSYIMTYRYLLI